MGKDLKGKELGVGRDGERKEIDLVANALKVIWRWYRKLVHQP